MISKIFRKKDEKRELKEIGKKITLENEIMEKLAQYQERGFTYFMGELNLLTKAVI